MAAHTDKDKATAQKKAGSVVFWMIGAGALFAFYESFVLLALGMVPSLVANFIDRTARKNAARTVAYANFAGCVPWLMDYWLVGGGLDRVFQIVGNPYTLLIMYTTAAAGWLLYFALQPGVATYLTVAAEIKEAQLKRRQEQLVESWGERAREEAESSDLLGPAPNLAGADD